MRTLRRPTTATILLGVVLPALGYTMVRNMVPSQPGDLVGLEPDSLAKVNAAKEEEALRPEEQVVAVTITATFCGANRTEGFVEALGAVRGLIESQLTSGPLTLHTVGISVDWDVGDGVEYLLSIQDFDEVVAGANWVNTGTAKYVWCDLAVAPSIPQILLFRRTVTRDRKWIRVSDERLLGAKVGAADIMSWVEAGAPLPSLHVLTSSGDGTL